MFAETIHLPPNGRLDFLQTFLSPEEADVLLGCFLTHIRWQQDSIHLHGKPVQIPRLQAWYGEPEASYSYSGLRLEPQPMFEELKKVRTRLEQQASASLGTPVLFNAALCNLYRDGQDSVSWHADDEPELGLNPVIASLSLGGTRTFSLQHKKDKSRKYHLELPHNSLLLMSGDLQHHWRHQVAKTRKVCEPRVNLTFRRVF